MYLPSVHPVIANLHKANKIMQCLYEITYTTIHKCGISKIELINTFIQQRSNVFVKSNNEGIYNVIKMVSQII